MTVNDFQSDVIERLARIEEHVTSSRARGEDHETRIRAVEKLQYALMGGSGILGALFWHIGNVLWK